MRVIERDCLPGISSVTVDGVVHQIGLLKDFHRDPVLNEFVPATARLSLSWVRLLPGEELAVHQHPTRSMIVVTEGVGRTLGELEQDIRAGDVVLVPSDAKHGFVGTGAAGFWALSVQFEGTGLYEDVDRPRVAFDDAFDNVSDSAVDQTAPAGPTTVRALNEQYLRAYRDSALVQLVSDVQAHPPAVRERLLDHLQYWSDAFQRVITARVAAETEEAARELAELHQAEEAGHHLLLAEERDGRPAAWDPVIAATGAWFVDQMTTLDSPGRTVLAHLVLEGSGLAFHTAALPAFPDSRYFQLHSDADLAHLELGYQALTERQDWAVDQVSGVLREGWQLITLLSDRIAERALHG